MAKRTLPQPYPEWRYFPQWASPPAWVAALVNLISQTSQVDSNLSHHNSNEVLKHLASGLRALGYKVEAGKVMSDRIPRPVFFGENGRVTKSYDIDAYHPGDRVAVEVEAGRSLDNNAIYKDLVQMC